MSLGKKQRTQKIKALEREAKVKKGFLHVKSKKMKRFFLAKSPFAEANQGTLRHNPFQSLVRSCKLYHQFATLASFDAVQVDEDLARQLLDKKKEVCCLTQVERDAQLAHLREEILQKHIVYVLADVRSEKYEKLTDENAQWKLFLKEKYGAQPLIAQKIIQTDLDAETRLLFGENWREVSAFKTLYKFEFPRARLQPHELACSLIVSSPLVSDEIVWPVQPAEV